MMRTILIPFETSAKAGLAVEYASAIARATRGRLILYSVIPDEALRYHAESQLARAAEHIEQSGIGVTTRIEHRAEVATAIIDTALADGADLIAMATSAWSDLDRWLRGSVADEVLRQAEMPVLIVPAQASQTVLGTTQGIGTTRQRALTLGPAWPSPGEQQLRILVTLDGSDLAAQALGPARALAGAMKAELLLLRVVEPPALRPSGGDEGGMPAWAHEPLGEAEQYLETVAATIPSSEGSVRTLAIVGDPPAAIAEAARTHGAHLIAMATRGRGGLERQLLGSVATATLQQASVPMLLLRPTALSR
jgi:nucleotide-binding universal stress UspA family protein